MKKLVLFIFLISTKAYSAACCGGGVSGMPLLITGDFKALFMASLSQDEIIGDDFSKSQEFVFYSKENQTKSEVLSLKNAYLLSDTIQFGFGTGVLQKRRALPNGTEESSSGLTDSHFQLTYEFLPERYYSVWKPRAFFYTKWVFPTGSHTYESENLYRTDVHGLGLIVPSLGVAFFKILKQWDLLLTTELHHGLSRDFDGLKVEPSLGGSLTLAAGYNTKSFPLRIGFALTPKYEGKKKLSGTINSETSSQIVWDTMINISYLLPNSYSLSTFYRDQTLMGPAKNTDLTRSVGVSLTKQLEL